MRRRAVVVQPSVNFRGGAGGGRRGGECWWRVAAERETEKPFFRTNQLVTMTRNVKLLMDTFPRRYSFSRVINKIFRQNYSSLGR